jgi:hypothetical protein
MAFPNRISIFVSSTGSMWWANAQSMPDTAMAHVVNNVPHDGQPGQPGQPVALIETPGNAPPIDILEIADPPRQMKIEVSSLSFVILSSIGGILVFHGF